MPKDAIQTTAVFSCNGHSYQIVFPSLYAAKAALKDFKNRKRLKGKIWEVRATKGE